MAAISRKLARVELVSLSPFPAECLLWEADAGQPSLTVIVKMTLRLVHDGEAVVDETQLPISGDETWDDNPAASLFHPGDRAPLKPKTDLLLVGRAYAPGGEPVDKLTATMKVGDFVKSVTVSATRLWTRSAAGFVPGPPLPFEQMPLRYERGALSPDNPVGVDPNSAPLESAAVGPVLAAVAPATFPCFGPIASSWRPRRRLLAEAGRFWALAFEAGDHAPTEPAPRALDFKFFNAAPPDQQTNMLRQRAEIELTNLHPVHPVLRTRLPALKPQVFHVGANGGRPVDVALRCDTVWIDSDRGICCLSWRGLTDVPSMNKSSVGKIIVVADPQGRRVRWEQVERAIREGIPIEATEPGATDALSLRHDAVRSRENADVPSGSVEVPAALREKDETRAFGPGTTGEGARAVLPFESSGANPAFGSSGANPMASFGSSGANPVASFGSSGANPVASFGSSGANPPASFGLSGANPPASFGAPRVEDDTADRLPESVPAQPLPFAPRAVTFGLPPLTPTPPAMVPVPPVPPGDTRPLRAVPETAPPPPPGDTRPLRAVPEPAQGPPPPGDTRPMRSMPEPVLASDPDSPASSKPLGSGVGLPAKPASIGPIQPRIPAPAPSSPGLPFAPKPGLPLPPKPPNIGPIQPKHAAAAAAAMAAALGPDAAKADGKSKPPPAEAFDPKEMSIATYGSVSAELMIRRGERAKVLDAHKLSEPAWARIHAHWTAEMGRETARGESKLLAQFDAAYVETMGRLRKPIGVPEYALILVAIERGAVDKQLAKLELSLSDLMRVQRVWTRKLAEEPELQKTVGKAVEEARSATA
ncbi:MAG: DUF2169 domain-containing protein [Polyangiaceae bacterium]